MNENKITCPNCGHPFDVEMVLAEQAELKVRQQLESKFAGRIKSLESKEEAIRLAQEEFELKKQKENEMFQQKLKEKLEIERKEMAIRTEREMKEQFDNRLKLLTEENEKRKRESELFKQKELEFMRRESEMKEKEENLKVEAEKLFYQKKEEAVRQALQQEHEKFDLLRKEYETKFEQQKKLLDEAQRKASQGSMQMQGEVLELVLEDVLGRIFPYDRIEEVSKGVRGADIIQTVVNGFQQPCGKIIYESKRTKAFSNDWIAKLKEDQRQSGADLAVIVTEVFPKDMDKFGRVDGVWICNFSEVESLAYVLRELLIRESAARSAEENKGDKKELLYNYMVSGEFVNRVKAIVDAFNDMKNSIDRERRAMESMWKKRDRQIDIIIANTLDMYGTVKGIGGNSIGSVQALELPSAEEDETEEDLP